MPAELDAARSPAPVKGPVSASRERSVWNQYAKRLLQSEMAKRGVSYKELARLLEREGRDDSDESLMTRVNRGTFSLAFFLQAMRALGANGFDISHMQPSPGGRPTNRK